MSVDGDLKRTILVVDDTPDALRFLTDALEDEFDVLVATSGEQALDVLSHAHPDLILMDAVMPGLSGFETTRQLKADPSAASIPVIFMTGLTGTKDALQAFEAGGIDYVRKPIVIDELFARIRAHIEQAREADRTRMALDAMGRAMVAVTPDAKLVWYTPQARDLCESLAPGWRPSDAALPAELERALDCLDARRAELRETPLRVDVDGGAVEMRVLPDHPGDEILIRLSDLRESSALALLVAAHDLTQREAEVLLWLSYGKPNRAISEILEISPRTVNKHLEQIFIKLGVETRAAAAAIAVRTTVV